MQNFDPFLDWEALDDDIAADLHKLVRNNRRLTDEFCKMKRGDEGFAQKARDLIINQQKTAAILAGIVNHVYTVPAMVHIAG